MSRSSRDRKWGKNRGLAFNTSTAEVLFHPGGSRTVLLVQGSVSGAQPRTLCLALTERFPSSCG